MFGFGFGPMLPPKPASPAAPKPVESQHEESHGLFGGIFDSISHVADRAQTAFDTGSLANHFVQSHGLTEGARAGNAFGGAADTWKEAGAAGRNLKNIAPGEQLSFGDSLLQSERGARGPLNAGFEALEPAAKVTGGALSALSLAKGGLELKHGDYGQGGLDVLAGGLGAASIAQPELAPAAAVAGLTASGNENLKQWTGVSGTDIIGKGESGVFNGVSGLLGGGTLGKIGGGAAAALTAPWITGAGLTADFAAGGAGLAKEGWDLASKIPAPLAPFLGPLGVPSMTNSLVNNGKSTFNTVSNFLGGGIPGDIAGGIAAPAGAVLGTGADVVSGGFNTVKNIGGGLVHDAGSVISDLNPF